MNFKIKVILLLLLIGTVTLSFIDLNNLDNYTSQAIPGYIIKDNTPLTNTITNKGATLGRVLFYDKQLSLNNQIACASCHIQKFAFGDTARLSVGFNGGLTGRHSMRLVNSRFSVENKFFWDERASSLEDQTTRPIQDFSEMGFSGTGGQPGIDSLIKKLSKISYYNTLFKFVYGDTIVTELRMQSSLAQFVRSIQSFDSKFDIGLAQAGNLNANFPNYTALENQGKQLFLDPPPQGGAGCQGCHRAPEFDIDPNTLNNGVIADAKNGNLLDLTNTRAPSLRDIFNSTGQLNGPLMHNANFTTIDAVINHYNLVPINVNNTNLDPRLQGPGGNLQLNQNQKNALIAFLKTLSGNQIYNDTKWSDPFDVSANLLFSAISEIGINKKTNLIAYPNPVIDYLYIKTEQGKYQIKINDISGKTVLSIQIHGSERLDLSELTTGTFFIELKNLQTGTSAIKKVVKQ